MSGIVCAVRGGPSSQHTIDRAVALAQETRHKALFYSLSVGSGMVGNGSLIGASANMVTAGITERAGYPISYLYFLKKCLPALLITVGLASGWLLVRFLVLGGSGGKRTILKKEIRNGLWSTSAHHLRGAWRA